MANLATIKRCVKDIEPGEWEIEHTEQSANGAQLFVLRDSASQHCLVLRNDTSVPEGRRIVVPDIGQMTMHPVLADPTFDDLRLALDCYDSVHILRYRPGKRITIAAQHRQIGPVILKCTAAGTMATFTKQTLLWAARDELNFMVSRPIAQASNGSYFVQDRLAGEPLAFGERDTAVCMAQRIATAVATLHTSSIQFQESFDFRDQFKRTARYLDLIATQHSYTQQICTELATQLESVHSGVTWPRVTPLVPIHGSLHSHQWLDYQSKLGLVDFDRACMGHPELDIATFLAEWDFEKQPYSSDVNRAFLDQYAKSSDVRLSQQAIACYRAHKHISKAYKASKSNNNVHSLKKVKRNLLSAQRILLEET